MTDNRFDKELKKIRDEWERERLSEFSAIAERAVRSPDAEEGDERPPEIPLESRFEGTWIVGRQGTGKTQLFQHLLMRDLNMVARGEACVVVLDPTGDKSGSRPTLIHVLTRLKRFAPGGDLYGKLIYIDPEDENYTLPINPLALRADLSGDKAISSAIGSYMSIMGGLMGQPLTKFQDPVFRYAVQIALAFPKSNLETLQDIIAVPPRPAKGQAPAPALYEQVFQKLRPAIQRFLRTSYESEGPRGSRGEIMNRLNSLNADPLFTRIFSARETKIDFHREINRPNVIVINATRDLPSIKELYGRYFLALIKAAGEHRPDNPIPCFIYIDECDEFVSNDENAADIVLKLRRNRLALILGNQQTSRIRDAGVREAFLGTAIKFVNSNEASARELASSMNLVGPSGRPEITPLVGRPRFDFAFFVAGEMDEPAPYRLKPFEMNRLPKMTESEWQQVRQEIRDRYYERVAEQAPSTPTEVLTPSVLDTAGSERAPKVRPDAGTEGSTNWG